jgi:transposase-like protein
LASADGLPAGTIGAFLRREGIYSSQLYAWRKQRDAGEHDPRAVRKRARSKSESSLREKLIKIGAKVVSHGRYVAFQMAEVAIPATCPLTSCG